MFKKIASRLMLVLMFITLTSCAGRDSDTSSTPKESTSTSNNEDASKDEKSTADKGDRTTIV
ncbi:MAG: ABC transporter substrate-binding protein, partial [Anaerococcus sp.]|nr:ABC transporter substrate-binding protein [Anaerococcus sp.]